MQLINGNESSEIIANFYNKENNSISFYLVTAYENETTINSLKGRFINDVNSKPINAPNIKKMFKDYFEK